MVYKSGFATIIGRPNVGKSTLINKLIGQKINITSRKPQTTRNQIKTIYNSEEGQIIFVDTPGIHKPKDELDEYMLNQAYQSLEGIDVIILLLEANSSFGQGDNFIIKQINGMEKDLLVVMNKIDLIDKNLLRQRKNKYEEKIGQEVIPVSAKTGKNLDFLVEMIFSKLPEGPQYYPEDMITDKIERFVIGEIIREKTFELLRDEVPYGVAVVTEEVKERENDMFYVRANIYVEKKSHKGIVIGKNGKMLRKIGRRAREDVEKLLQADVYLDLWVKVHQDWRDNNYLLRQLGYK
ncbi:MAG: GTPase Era [bacterium]